MSTLFVHFDKEYDDMSPETFKYLTIKSNVWIEKLNKKYPGISAKYLEKDPGNVVVRLKNWLDSNDSTSLRIIMGDKHNPCSFWVRNSSFESSLGNNGMIPKSSFNVEFEMFCEVLDKLNEEFVKFASK